MRPTRRRALLPCVEYAARTPGRERRMTVISDVGGTLICLCWLILFWWAAREG